MLNIGEFLNDRYRIEKLLGEGGMGIVYLGRDLDLERFVAVKEIKAALPDYDKYIERIKKEAKILAKLNHPNIVILYDLIQYQDNWYLVMEYVEGVALDKKLEQAGALPYQEATPIFKQLLVALDHAHQAGVIHRDFKPGNAMIKADGQVKVMDFGLAKIQTNPGAARSSKSEQTGGTLYYLSPEQVEGKPVDHRSDIYSLGMACYEVLAGYMPLKEKKTTVEILNAIRRDNFPSPTKFKAAVPKELSKIVGKAIALKPEKRFQNAGEMLAAIEEIEQKAPLPPPRRRIRLVVEIFWTIAIVLLTAGVILFTDWDSRLIEAIGLSKPTILTIITEPDGAEVILNGKAMKDGTPLKKLRAKSDTNYVQIRRADFFGIDTTIVLQKSGDSTLTFSLKPLARIAALVKPPEAEIVFDGRAMPLSELSQLALPVGERRFVVALEGYKTIDTTIVLAQGLNTISFALEKIIRPPPEGRISLTSEPSSADVEMRGPVNIRKQTPIKNLKVPAGKYEIGIRYAKYADSLLVATVDSGGFFSRHVKLKPLPGRLNLTINPKSAVYINERLVHENTDRYERKLAAGAYDLKISHSGTDAFWADSINIAPAGEFTKEFDFGREFRVRITTIDSASNDNPSAEIYVDGVDIKKTTPNEIVLRFGHHEIEVRAEGYEPQRMKRNVESTTKLLQFKLKRSR